MNIKPIRKKADYEMALKEIGLLMDANPRPGTPKADKLDVLATLVEAYEAKHYPIAPPDPVEAILFAMEQTGITRKDLETVLGSRSRVSEILNRRRRLTMPMAWRLHHEHGIPAESLLRPYDLTR